MVLSMARWSGKAAVVTGASAGIGAAIVEKLVDSGLKVAGLARRKERLEDLQNKLRGKAGRFYPVVADIAKEDDVLKAFQWTKKNVGPVHILINNAGIVRTTSLVDGDAKLWKEVFDTNVLGLCVATREAVKDMRANNVDGHIIHINSIAGRKVSNVPNFNVYSASKHAVTALTETLRLELNFLKSKVKITSISPGLVDTEITMATALASGKDIPDRIKEWMKVLPSLEAVDVADAVMYALSTPPHVQVHELTIKPIGEKV